MLKLNIYVIRCFLSSLLTKGLQSWEDIYKNE